MLFSRVLSFFAFSFAVTLLSTAKPIAEAGVVKRAEADTADVASVFNNLKVATDSILPQIDALANSGNTDSAKYTALINQLADSLNGADTSLTSLKGKPGKGKPGPSKNELAKLIASIVIAITKTLSLVLIKVGIFLPSLTILIFSLDAVLHKLLFSVDFLLTGVLFLVSGLLFDVAGLLKSIGFSLVLGLLKL